MDELAEDDEALEGGGAGDVDEPAKTKLRGLKVVKGGPKGVKAAANASASTANVPPAYQSSVWSTMQMQVNSSGATSSETINVPVAVPPSERLQNFYLKYNRALLDCVAIEKERDRLQEENNQLEDLIQQFLDGMKLSDTVLADDNPLFVVNGRANLNQALPVRMANPTVQDAVNIRNTMARQLSIR